MIFLLFVLNTIYNENKITIQTSTSSMTKIQVEFSDVSQAEQIPITRFIVANSAPRYEYKIFGIDSFTTPDNIKDINTSPVDIGKPLNIKNCNVYPIIIYPSYLNKNIKEYYGNIEITLNYTPPVRKLRLSPSLSKVFKNLILNFEENEDSTPLGYLIITPNSFEDEVQALAEWKEKKGWHVTVATLSQTGSTPTDIKNYISNAYHYDSPPPEYVLLIGDKDSLPPHGTATPVSTSDYSYTLLDGDDFLAELLIGRLPANTSGELNTMIAKILGYERDPYMDETSWFTRALMVAANYPIGMMTTPIPTKQLVKERLLEYGFNTVDTVYYPPTSGGAQITSSINQGVIFVNYRGGDADPNGWVHPSYDNDDVTGLTNGWKLPVVTSITCLNGNFGYSTCFGEAWLRAGNQINPRGAVAFFGASSPATHSRWNNCLDMGIYWGFLQENIYNLGPALYRGKMEVFTNFPGDTSWMSGSSFYFHTYNLLGDPALDVWTDIPDTFIVSHSTSIPVGTNYFSVEVQNSSSQPVENAIVSLYKNNEVKAVKFTNSAGQATFNFSTSSQDTLFVTVTKHNFKPYCGDCLVNSSTVYVGHYDHSISDPTGNNNGEVNPGEAIEMQVTLKNYGTSTIATNVSAKLTSTDPLITITDSMQNYSNIAPGGTATGSAYDFDVSSNAKNSHIIKFNLYITTNQGNWNSSIWIDVKAPEFVYQRHQILDGNGALEPGETSDMIVSIENTGSLIGNNTSGILISLNPGVSVGDSIGSFGNIPVGDSSANSSNYFTVNASSSISPGHAVGFIIILSGADNFKDTVEFALVIGVVDQTKPLGRDLYGYFAYDDTDVGYSERPTYNWIEIDPELGGAGDSLSLGNDETKTINLPFSFKFYGDWYDRVSICSNGYIAMDSTWIADMYNWHILSAGGPPLLIAPFWDDLDPTATDSSGHVCYWYDVSNHKFIIEYSRVQHIHDPTNPTPAELQTFEVLLFDPQYYPTETGDGEILFQYKKITNDDVWHNYATVGIENREHTIGLEYTYANIYPDAAAPLANNRAIKFTTDPPDTFPGIEEHNQTSISNSILEVYPNPFRKMLNIKLQIPSTKSQIALKIYDVSGRLVRSFNLASDFLPLASTISWDGTDDSGNEVPQGVYFLKAEGTNSEEIKKIILLK